MGELKEKTLQHETIRVVEATTPFAELDERIRLALECASEKKAWQMVALDLRGVADFTDVFIIASAANTRQAQAISDEIEEQLKKQLDSRPSRIEGYNAAEWILLDYGDFLVHIFEQKVRAFYDLERLWRDAKKVELPAKFQS
jgi:ribosome-associated protein